MFLTACSSVEIARRPSTASFSHSRSPELLNRLRPVDISETFLSRLSASERTERAASAMSLSLASAPPTTPSALAMMRSMRSALFASVPVKISRFLREVRTEVSFSVTTVSSRRKTLRAAELKSWVDPRSARRTG